MDCILPPFSDDEQLFRSVLEILWNFKENRPSTQAFSDSEGLSVDRQMGRTVAECIEFMLSQKTKPSVIVSLRCGFCLSMGLYIKSDSQEYDPFHCLLLKSKTENKISPKSVCRRLAESCQQVSVNLSWVR